MIEAVPAAERLGGSRRNGRASTSGRETGRDRRTKRGKKTGGRITEGGRRNGEVSADSKKTKGGKKTGGSRRTRRGKKNGGARADGWRTGGGKRIEGASGSFIFVLVWLLVSSCFGYYSLPSLLFFSQSPSFLLRIFVIILLVFASSHIFLNFTLMTLIYTGTPFTKFPFQVIFGIKKINF